METVYVRGRDELAAAILATALDVDTVIILERKGGGRTRYTFPAVCYPDGGEVRPHGHYITTKHSYHRPPRKVRTGTWSPGAEWVPMFSSPEQHAAWQRKRRADIAKRVKAKGRKWFE